MLHHSQRTATVVSQDQVQLLAVGRDDFFDIFMAGSGPEGIPDHIQYTRSVHSIINIFRRKSLNLADIL